MELADALNQRRSIRSYTGEPPTQEQLDHILTAAYEAPVGMGKYDSLHLTIITNKDLLAKIDKTAATAFGRPDGHPLYGAPMLIVVSSNAEGNVASANVANVLENMSLAAVQEGVGSCLIYGALSLVAQNDEIIDAMQLPEGYKPVGSIILGQTDDSYEPREVPDERIFSQNVVA